MKLTKQILCLVLALMMMLAVVACGGGEETTGTTTPAPDNGPTTPGDDDNSKETDLPDDINFNGREMILYSRVQTANANSFKAEKDGTVVNNAVFDRNDDLAARLNCKLNYKEFAGNTNDNTMYDEMKALTDGFSYHIITTATYKMVRLAVEGMLHNLADKEYISLEKDYYDDGYNEALNAGGRQYLVTGKFTISWYRYQVVCMFNRNLVFSSNLEYPYDTVLDQKWTTAKMMEYSTKMYKDLNGNNKYDVDDQFGLFMFVGSSSSQTDGFMGAFKLRLVNKTDDGYFGMIDIDRATWGNALNDLIKMIEGNGSYCTNTLSNPMVEQKFIDGQAGMICYRMYVVENEDMMKLGRTEKGYGIVPLPKANEEQDDYSSYVQDQVLTFGIPATAIDTDAAPRLTDATIFLEAFAYESYKTVMPAYYERALTKRYVIDERSKAMIEIIDTNIYVDPVNVYYGTYFNLTTGSLRGAYDGSTTVSALLEAAIAEDTFLKKVQDLNDAYKKLANPDAGEETPAA